MYATLVSGQQLGFKTGTEDVLGSVDVVLGYVVAHLKKEESKFCGGAP